MGQNIVIKGIPQKNKSAYIVMIIGAALLLISLVAAIKVRNSDDIWIERLDTLGAFIIGGGFIYSYFGYTACLGIIALIVGLIIKVRTEKGEITVTRNSILGKLPNGTDVNVPLNQITAINKISHNGISIASIGNDIIEFYCIENRDEVMSAITALLTAPQQGGGFQTANDNGVEQLSELKELLEAGALTQKEFDDKKKKILGL